jgi:hypothetical protein
MYLLSFSFLALAACGSTCFSGSLGVSTGASSSLAEALGAVLDLIALVGPAAFLFDSAVPGVFGVVSFNLVVVLGVLTGYSCRLAEYSHSGGKRRVDKV